MFLFPVPPSTTARALESCPFIVLERPPMITLPVAGSTASARTSSSVVGAHGSKTLGTVLEPGVAAPRRDRARPPTDEKLPPNTAPPTTKTARPARERTERARWPRQPGKAGAVQVDGPTQGRAPISRSA